MPSKIEISLDLSLDEYVKKRLPLLILLIVFMLFSFLLFASSNLSTLYIFDFSHLQYNLSKLYSLHFIMFIIFFSLTLGGTVFYGFGAKRFYASLPLPIYLVVAFISVIFMPSMLLPFVGFAFALGTASIFASFYSSPTFGHVWAVISKALLIFVLIVFIFSFLKFSLGREFYFNLMLDGAASFAPSVSSQFVGVCASAINNTQISRADIESSVSKDDVRAMILQQYGALFSMLNSTQQQKIVVDQAYESVINNTVEMGNKIKSQIASKMMQTANKKGEIKLTPERKKQLLTQLSTFPQFNLFRNYFPILLALGVTSLVSVLDFFIQIISSLFCYFIFKISAS